MKFNDILKYFLKNTKSKSGDLAKFVGYDISYISKWTSGVKIPSEGTSEEVIDKVSRFFTDVVCEKNLEEVIINLSPRRLKLKSRDAIYITLKRFFSDSYNLSLSLYVNYKERGKSKCFTLTGTKNISEFTLETIFKHISASEKDIDIYSTVDIPKLFDINTVNNMNIFITKNIKVSVKTALPIDRYSEFNRNNVITELLLLFKSFDMDFQIFDSNKFGDFQVILMENKFVIIYRYLPDGSKIATYTEDDNVVSIVQSNLKNLFDGSEEISTISNDYKFEFENILESSENEEDYLIANTFPSGLCLTDGNLEYIEKNYNIDSEKMNDMRKLLESTKKSFYTKKLELVFLNSKLDEFIELKKINLLDEVVFLDSKNMKEYLESLVYYLKSNDNINTYILKESVNLNPEHINSTFYLSNINSFVKKDKYYTNKNVSLYYSFLKPSFCKREKEGLTNLLKESTLFYKDKQALIDYINDVLIKKLDIEIKEDRLEIESM
ncbi:MAG: hypothetical protein Q4P31_02535 [Andreesenia angusta]|nr:hypothetical protein [Andreesenia angusta]